MHHIRFLLACAAFSLAFMHSRGAEQAVLPKPALNAEAAQERFVDLFMPFRTDKAALSPDGKHIAYTLREGENLSIVILEIDNPGKVKAKVIVATDDAATPMLDIQAKEKTPAAIRWMRWVTTNRLVVETNRNFAFNRNNVAQIEPTTEITGIDSTWLNCSGEILGIDADGNNARSLLKPRDIPEFAETTGGGSGNINTPRSPHVFDFADDDTDSILIHAEGIRWSGGVRHVQRYKLNVVTGKLHPYKVHTISVGKAYLFDRQGTPRISVSTSTIDPFPHNFMCVANALFKQAKPIDEIFQTKDRSTFFLSPANYFGQRSIPLGFGKDTNVIYYASNLGRETYGIYSFDLKTGKPTTFAAESPTYDLYVPASGIFPNTNLGTVLSEDYYASITPAMDEGMSATSVSSMAETGSSNSSLQALQQSQASANALMDSLNTTQKEAASYISRLSKRFTGESLLGNLDKAPLVFDRFTHDIVGFRYEGKTLTCSWFNPNITEVQSTLEKKFPNRIVDVQEWDSSYHRFLVRVQGPADSGAFYIYDRTKPQLAEFVQRAPWLNRENTHNTIGFSYTNAAGRVVTGTFTFPRVARSIPIPLIAICQPQPWARVHADFQPDLQAYAEMGFAIVQVNPLGAWGFGMQQRDAVIGGAYEKIQAADIMDAIEHLSKRFAINSRRMAITGKSHGGYLALRTMQLYPDRFRCAVALDSILDFKSWMKETRWTSTDTSPKLMSAYFGDPDKLPDSALKTKPETITKPVLFLNYRGMVGKGEIGTYVQAKALHLALKRNDVPTELFDLSDDYVNGLPRAKAEAFRKIEDFLNTYIYDYQVKMGDLKIIKED